MKKIIFLLLISILSLNLFAHTKMYHIDISANFLSFDEEINREPTVDELVSGKSDEEFIDDTLQCFNFSAGIITFFDKDDSDKVFMPIFDFQAGVSFGTPYVLGWYSQYLGGISFRPISFLSFNLAAGFKLTGAWHTFEFLIVPDTYWLDGIVDASLSLKLISFGLRTGIFMNIGTSGFGLFPFLSITFDKED